MSKTTVNINDKYKVEIDEYNHTLMVFKPGGVLITFGKKKGEMTVDKWDVVGYFPNLSQCINKVVFLDSLEGGEVDLNGYVTRLENLVETVKAVKV